MNGEHCTDATSPNNDPLLVAALDNDDALGLGFFILNGSTAFNDNDESFLLLTTLRRSKLH